MRFYPASQAARMVGVSRETMNKRINRNEVAAITKNGRHYVLDTGIIGCATWTKNEQDLLDQLSSNDYIPVKDVPLGAEFWRLHDELWLVHKKHIPPMDTKTKRQARRYPTDSITFTVTFSEEGYQALNALYTQLKGRGYDKAQVVREAVLKLDEQPFDAEATTAWAAAYSLERNARRLSVRWTPDDYAIFERIQAWYQERMKEVHLGVKRRWHTGKSPRSRLCDYAVWMAGRVESVDK